MANQRELSPRLSYSFANESRIEVEEQDKGIAGRDRAVDRNSMAESIASQWSSTKSASESIFRFIEENGRTYHSHAAGSYFFPNDQPEIDRLDLQFYIFRLVLNDKDFCAPLSGPKSILDIGTGTGKWASEMADRFPDADVLGTDLSPIQPEWNPANLSFLVDDANEEDWGSQKYDYIHTRMLLGAFEDYSTIIKRSFDYLEPGGYMESQELYPRIYCNDDEHENHPSRSRSQNPDLNADPSNKFFEWVDLVTRAANQVHRPLEIAPRLKSWYEAAGFVDVHEVVLKLPIGPWPKDPQFKMVGKFWQQVLFDGLQGLCMAFFHRAFGWTRTEIEIYLVDVRKALLNLDSNANMYQKFYVVWGKKPER